MAAPQSKKSKPVNKSTNPTGLLDTLSKSTTHEIIYPEEYLLNNEQGKKFRKQVGKTLLQWAAHEDSLEISDFCFEYGIRRETLWDWRKKYPDLQQDYEQAMRKIASRRSTGSYKKIYADTVFRNIHEYDQQWEKTNQYHADLKNNEEDKNITFVVNTGKPDIVSTQDFLLEVNQTQEPQS